MIITYSSENNFIACMRIKKCETVFSLISQVLISSVLLRTDAFNKIISNKDFDSNNTLYCFSITKKALCFWALSPSLLSQRQGYLLGLTKIILLFPEIRVTRKKFSMVTANLFFLIKLIESWNKVYTKKLLKHHFSLLKNIESYLLLFEEEKRPIRPTKFVSGKPP